MIQSCLETASTSPPSPTSAVPAWSLRPSSPSGQPITTHALALGGQPVDPRRHPRQQRIATTGPAERVCARAVDRRPDDLGRDVARRSSGGDDPVPGSRMDAQAVRLWRGLRTRSTLRTRASPSPPASSSSAPARASNEGAGGGTTPGSAGRASATSASPSRSSSRSPSRATSSGVSSGGGSRSVTSAGPPSADARGPPRSHRWRSAMARDSGARW